MPHLHGTLQETCHIHMLLACSLRRMLATYSGCKEVVSSVQYDNITIGPAEDLHVIIPS